MLRKSLARISLRTAIALGSLSAGQKRQMALPCQCSEKLAGFSVRLKT